MSDDGIQQQNFNEFDTPQSPEPENLNAPQSPTEELRELYGNDEQKSAASSPSSTEQIRSPSPEDQGNGEGEQNVDAGEQNSTPNSPVREEDDDEDDHIPRKRAIIDSDDEEDNKSESAGPSSSRKRALIDSDGSDNEQSTKNRLIGSDNSDDEGDRTEKPDTQQLFGDDSDDDADNQEKKEGGDEGEFVERNDEEEGGEVQKIDDSDDDEGPIDRNRRGDSEDRTFEWDFDAMMKKKKLERKRKVRRGGKDGGIDIVNDDDGTVGYLVERMKAAAKADRNANLERKPAFQKIKLLPEVKSTMMRAGIVEVLVDNGFMSVLSEWLAPLPDKCLPALDIRITVLKLLHNPRFWKLDRSTLKQSGLGKAVMLLYKHPNETKQNKAIANKLIGEWARPIFQLDTDYSAMSREERVHMDLDRMPEVKKKKFNNRREVEDVEPEIREVSGIGPTSSGQLKPGDKGYINRARVPKPSTKDYVVRPKWNVEGECKDRKATGTRRYDQALRDFQERTKKSKGNRAITVSLEGRNLEI